MCGPADAERALQQVLNTAYEYAVLADETFSFVLLNPPYDGEGHDGRRPAAGRNVPARHHPAPRCPTACWSTSSRISASTRRVARHLAGWYDDLRCFKLAGDDYDAFKQIVIFGVRRKTYTPASGDDLRAVQAWAEAKIVIGYEQIEVEVEGELTARRSADPAEKRGAGEEESTSAHLRRSA